MAEGRIAAAKKMVELCKKSLANNEYNVRKVKGVRMSYADVETAILYGDTIMRFGSYSDGGNLMQPRCEVRDLMAKFGLLEA